MRKYIRVIFFCICPILWAYFTWIIRYSRHPEKYPLEVRFRKVKKLIIKVLNRFRINYHMKDMDKVFQADKEDSKLIVCDHLSIIDPLFFIANSEKPITFAAKIEIKKIPFVGKIIKALDGVFLDRDDLKQQFKVMRHIEEMMKTTPNLDWVIFPEGTRNKDLPNTPLLELHHGTFRPAVKSNKKIIYCYMWGSQYILPLKYQPKKFDIYMNYLGEFSKEEVAKMNTQEIADICYESMKNEAISFIETENKA